MLNRVRGACAPASGVARLHGERLLRIALLGSTAIVGVSLANPVAAQTISPAGGGTISTTGGTVSGGGVNQGVLVQQTASGGVTVTGVTITNTGTTPTADGLRVVGPGGRGVGLSIAETSTITSQTGDGVRLQGGSGENVGFGIATGRTLNVTGVNGINITSTGSLFLSDAASAGAIVATARTSGSGTGVSIATSSGFGGSLGSVTATGFATGIALDGPGVDVTVEGGAINATGTGIAVTSTQNAAIGSQAAIVAPIGISVSAAGNAQVTTSGGGTINSKTAATGTGILATSTGSGTVAVTVGAAIGGTTTFATGVNANTTGSGAVSVTTSGGGTINGGQTGLLATSGSGITTVTIGAAIGATSRPNTAVRVSGAVGSTVAINANVSGSSTGLQTDSAVATTIASGATLTAFTYGLNMVTGGGSLTNNGAISGYFGIISNTLAAFNLVNTGTITGNGGGAIYTGATAAVIDNSGTIRGLSGGDGINSYNSGIITNSGTITGGAGRFAVLVSSARASSIVNNGTINADASAGSTAILYSGTSSNIQTLMLNAGSTTNGLVRLSGGIATSTVGGRLNGTYQGDGGGINNGRDTLTVSATGVINSTTDAVLSDRALTLVNSGTIVGATSGVKNTGNGVVSITNAAGGTIGTGTISGGVFTAGGTGSAITTAGSATIVNNGTLSGNQFAAIANAGLLTVTNRGTASGSTGDTLASLGTVNVLNSGLVTNTTFSAVNGIQGGTVVNAALGTLTGGNNASFGEAVQFGTGTALFTNYGSANSTIGKGVFVTNSAATTINLHAGSSTGSIVTGSGNDTLAIYNGRGTAGAATVDTPSGITLQNAGTLAAASFGAIDLGSGTNTLMLRGTGDGTAANGAAGSFSVATSTGASILTKADAGTWTLTGAGTGGLTTINAGTGGAPGSGGVLIFGGSGLTGTINVNGATIRATTAGAFGTGTINAIDPTVQYAATGTYANPIILQSTAPATDPTVLQTFGTGITATLTGLISQSGAAAQPLVFSSVDANGIQNTGTFVLTNGSNNYAGATTINTGTTVVQRNTASALGSGTITIGSGAVLQYDKTFANSSYTVEAGRITGTGTLRLTGPANSDTHFGDAGTITISLGSGGLIDVLGGLVRGSSSGQALYTGNLSDLNIASGAIFDGVEGAIIVDALSGAGTLRGGYFGSGSTTIGVDNGSGTFSGVISNSTNPNSALNLIKQGTGTQTLTGVNTYTGATTISGGTLALSGAGSIANTSVADNATFNIAGITASGTSIVSLSGTGTVTLGAKTLTLTGANTGSFGGAITGTGGLTVNGAGTYQLTGAGNTYSGTTTIGSGETLQGTTATFSANSNVIDNGALAFVQAASGTYTRNVSGTGVVIVSGLSAGNSVTLNGALTNAGGLRIVAGSGAIVGATGSIITNGVSIIGGNNTRLGVLAGGVVRSTGATTINADATFTIDNAGLIDGNGGNTIQTPATALTLNNSGIVSTSNFVAVLAGTNSLINNSGRISGGTDATYGTAVEINGSGSVVNQSGGTLVGVGARGISSSITGLLTIGNSANARIIGASGAINTVGTVSLVNAGSIVAGDYNIGTGTITVATTGTAVASADGTVSNNAGGRIIGGSSNNGGDNYGVRSSGALILTNAAGDATMAAGKIVGGYTGVEENGGATITNDGLIGAGTFDLSNTGTGVTDGYTIGGQDGIRLLGGGTVTNNAGALIASSGGSGVYVESASGTIVNSGTIQSANGVFTFGGNGQDLAVTNNEGGLIYATNGTGIYQGGPGALTVTNNVGGTIVATGGDAVHDDSFGLVTLINDGTLVGQASGLAVNGLVDITNTGLIGSGTLANGTSGAFTPDGFFVGISTTSGGIVRNNGGTIQGGTGGAGIFSRGNLTVTNTGTIATADLLRAGIDTSGAASSITNHGTVEGGAQGVVLNNGGTVNNLGAGAIIRGTGAQALNDASGIYANGDLTLVNEGTISTTNTGATYGVQVLGAGTITNSGTISGDGGSSILAGTGLTLDNSGTVTGFISTGQGATVSIVNRGGGTISSNPADGDLMYPVDGTVNILNAGTISTTGFSATGVQGTGSATITNAAGGVLRGGSSATYGGVYDNAVQFGGAALVFNNYGSATSSGGANAVYGTSNGVATVNLFAGSTTGNIQLGSGDDTVALYTGRGTNDAAIVDAATGITLQNSGALAAASFAAIDLGGGGNTLALRGTGDDAGNGAAGSLALNTIANVATITKLDSGNWTLTGVVAQTAAAATIYAGSGPGTTTPTPGSGGTLTFAGSGLTGDIYVNSATIVEGVSGAFGSGTIHAVDPTIVLANGTNANNYLLEVATPASADPTTFQTASGNSVTLTGSISTGTGVNGSGNNINGQPIDPNQPVTFALVTGSAPGSTANFLLTNTANSYSGATTIDAGVTLTGTTATISGGSITDNGALVYNQASDGTVAQAITGVGSLTKDGTGTVTLNQASDYTGGTNVLAGRLVQDNNGRVFGYETVAISQGATVELRATGLNYLQGGGVAFTGAGVLAKTGDGNIAFGCAGSPVTIAMAQGGLIDVQAGSLSGSACRDSDFSGNLGSLNVASGANFNGVEGNIIVDALTGTGLVNGGYYGEGSLTIGIANGTGQFDGVLADNDSNSGSLLTLTKTGSGTQTLTGTSTYTGPTTVAGGTLTVNGSIQSAVTVSSGANLTGSGSVGATTIADGGNLSGMQGSTLTMASLGLTAGSIINATFTGANGTALFGVTGDLTLDGTVNIADTGAFGFGVYRLISYGGALTNNGLLVGTTPSDAQRTTVQTAVAGQVNIVSSSNDLLFWDGGNAALYNNGVVNGGSGTWTATSPTFTDANGFFNGAMTPQPGFAIFEASPGTVTVDNSAGAISVTGMQFASNGYVVNGGAIGLADPSTVIRVGDGTNAGAAFTATIASALTGANGLNKTDLGTLIVSGANTYTGTTTISGGVLQGTTTSIVGSNIVDNAKLAYNQADSGTVTQAISGSGLVTVTGLATNNTLTFASTNTQTGGFIVTDASRVAFSGSNTGAATEVTTQVAGANVANSGMLAGTDRAITLGAGGTVTNAGGTISQTNTANITGNAAIYSSGNLSLTNSGTISTVSTGASDGVTILGVATVDNAGTIKAASASGLAITANGSTVTNTGTIQGGSSTTFGDGIALVGGTINNNASGIITGLLAGVSNTANALTINNAAMATIGTSGAVTSRNGIQVSGGSLTLNNSGVVNGGTRGVYETAGGLSVSNAAGGVIIGGTFGIYGVSASDNVVNTGTISSGTYNAGTKAITLGTVNNASGVYLTAGGTVTNMVGGLIEGYSQGVLLAGGGRVNNAGTITSTGVGNAVANFTASSAGVIVANTGTINFVNQAKTAWGVAFANSGNTIVNVGTISADIGVELLRNTGANTLTNGQGGQITGTIFSVETSGTGALALTNYGTLTGPLSVLATGANVLNLRAGSTTGALTTGAGNDTVNLYTGAVVAAPVVDATTGLTVRTGGTYGVATVGAINLGSGTNILGLLGSGDGSTANGAASSIDLATVTGATIIAKQGSGTWTLTGAANTAVPLGGTATSAATINVGTGAFNATATGGEGVLIFAGSGLTGTIYVNGAVAQATGAGTLGTGVIHMVDPTLVFATQSATYANNFVLDVASPASNPSPGSNTTTDPSTFQANAGVVATLTGTITTGTGNNINGKAIDPNQPVVIAGAGTVVLTNAGNAWTGVTTINQGATLRGTTATLSGASFTDNGLLNFNQAAAGTSARAIAGSGVVLIDGGGPVTLTGAISATGGVRVGAGTTAILSNVSNANSAANSNAVTFVGAGATLNVASGGSVASANGNAVYSNVANNTVNNAGTLAGNAAYTGIYFQSAAAGTNIVTNASSGTIRGFDGIYSQAPLSLTNAGQITGLTNNAVSAAGGGTIVNQVGGTLTATAPGGWGVWMNGSGTVSNAGTINADSGLVSTTAAGVSFTNSGTITATSNGVYGSGASVALTNTGNITGGGSTGTAGVRAEAAGSSITNSGMIAASSTAGVGVYMAGGTLTNQSSGVISGGTVAGGGYGTAIQLVGMGNVLNFQAGSTVNGLIDASGTTDGSNSYTFIGTLNGGFTGGSGNDTVTLVTPVTVSGTLDGGAGTDTLVLDGTGAGTLGSAQVVNFETGVKQGSGSWTLTGTTAASPTAFAINAGTLAVAGGNALADLGAVTIASGATLQLNASETIGSLAGAGSVSLGANTLTTGGLNASPTFSGVASGTGGLTKVGTGTLTLSGVNTYTGATTVSAGTLALGAANAIGSGSAVSVASGATLDLAANSDAVGSLTLAGTLAGTGTLTAATYTLTGGTANANLGTGVLTQASGISTLNGTSAAATVAINAGTLVTGASERIADSAAVTIAGGAQLTLGGAETIGSLAGAGNVALGANTLTTGGLNASPTFSGSLSGTGGLTKVGTGTLTLSGANGYTGVTTINAGTLAVSGGVAIADTSPVIVADGATLQLNASETIGSLNGAGKVVLGANTLTTGVLNANATFAGVASGTGGLTKVGTGTLTLSGANTYAGPTAVNGGTLALGASNVIADASAVSVAAGATLNLGASSDTVASLALNGSLDGTGTLTAATYTLNGATVNANLGAGVLTQASGSSVLNGTAAAATVNANAGTLALGASNRLADATAVTVASGAVLDLAQFSDTVGTANLNGSLNGSGTLTAATYSLNGARVNANLGAGTLNQVGAISVLSGTAAAATVNVNAGTLALGASDRLADTATLVIANGAIFDLGANSDTVGLAGIAGTLNGTGTLTAATYMLNGAMVNANLGSGTLVQGGGTSILSGTAATNMVAVMGGTLRLGASDRITDGAMLGVGSGATFDLAGYNETVGTLAGSGTIALGAGTLTSGGTNADYAFGGNLTGTGDLTKFGTGTFSLFGREALTGRMNVNGGTLMLAGATAGSVRVQGGTLTGASTIAGNLLLSSGALSPGTSTQPVATIQAGSLTVTGGTTVFDFGGMASGFTSDMLKVTGAATLSGGTVTTRGLDPSASYRLEQTYAVLQAGSLSGTFASGGSFSQVSNNSELFYRLRYDLLANGVVLEIRKQIDFTTTLGAGATGNQLAVASALNGGVLTGSDSFVTTLDAISSLSSDQRRTFLDNIGGESIADISTSVAFTANRFNDLLRHRLAVGGAGNSVDPSLIAGLANGKHGLDQIRASAKVGAQGSSLASGSASNRAGVWVQTFGGLGRLDGSSGTATIKDQSYGVAGGIDAKIAGFSIGGAFAVSALDTRVEGRGATNRGTVYQGGGYVAYDNGLAYANAVGTYFSGDVDSTRQVNPGAAFQSIAKGTSKVTGYTAGAAAGYRLPVGGGVRFTPQISMQTTHVDRAEFSETGAGVLSLSAGNDVRNLYTATVQGRLSHVSAAPGGIIEPYVGAGVAFNFGDLDTVSANRFTGAPTGTGAFSIVGARMSRTTALVEGGIEAHPNDRVSLGVGFETRLSNRERDGRVELHLRLEF